MIKIGLTDFTPASKIIDIRGKNRAIKAKYAIGRDDVLRQELMNEHFIKLSFEYNSYLSFERADYIEWEGKKYTIREVEKPQQVNKRKYQYTLKFEAIEMFFLDIQYYYLNQGLKEAEWRLTGNAQYFIKIAVDNINRYFGGSDFQMGLVELDEIKDITFDAGTNVFDALTQIADEYDAEWHITDKTILLLKKVSFGNEVNFETESSVLSMDREEGETSGKYTRIVALGSTRNIPYDYRETTPGEAVDANYPKRLRIPISKGDVVNAYPNMLPDEAIEGTVIFDEVYPKRIGTIEAVGTIEYTDTDEDTGEQTPWNAFTFKDSGIDFKEEYILPNQELRLKFQSGDLNGRDFALTFHPAGFSETDDSQFFEIIRTDEYGKKLPNDIMKPKAGDQYVLYGFNIALVSDQYVPEAEEELYDKATEWMQKQTRDTSVYECPTVIKYFTDNRMNLEIGQKVRLVHEQFENGGRSSRIMSFEKKLNNKYDAVYTVGDNSVYSRFNQIEKKIKELQVAGVIYEGSTSGGSGVYLIKQLDTTTPSDYNAFSSLRTLKEIKQFGLTISDMYLRKDVDDIAQGNYIFKKNITVDGSVFVGDVISSKAFTSGFPAGYGWAIMPYTRINAAGIEEKRYKLEIDDVTVRGNFRVHEMIMSQMRGENDNTRFTGMMKVDHYDDESGKIYLQTEDGILYNPFKEGDILDVQRYGGLPSAGNNYNVIKRYELRVTEASIGNLEDKEKRLDYIRFSNFIGNISDIREGDVLTRADNDTDSTRKGIMQVTTIDEFGVPYLDAIYGMKTDPANCVKARFGNLEGLVTPQWGRLKNVGIYCQNIYAVGEFRMKNGKDVQAEFEVLADRMTSQYSSIREEISQKDNFLRNAIFLDMQFWQSENNISIFNANNKLLYFNDSFYSNKKNVVDIVSDEGKTVLRIRDNKVTQLNKDLFDKPKEETTCYLSVRFKCIRGGMLSIGFADTTLFFSEELSASTEYVLKEYSAKWDGTGDFSVTFTGEIYIDHLAVTNNKLADLEEKVMTRFEQTALSISAIATRVSKIESNSAGWLTTAEGNTMWAAIRNKLDSSSDLISLINQNPYSTLISSSRINLNGAVTFSMLNSSLQNKMNMIDDMASDNKFTPAEKKIIYKEYSSIMAEYSVLSDKVTASSNASFNAGVLTQWNGYRNYYSLLTNYIAWPLGSLSVTSDIDGALFRKRFADYYSAKESLELTLAEYSANLSKNDIAIKVGYSNFVEMVDAASRGNTFIKGGYINTELLAANSILAAKIDVDSLYVTSLAAVRGKIAGWTIENNALSISSAANAKIKVEPSGTRFLRINDTASELMAVRADGVTGVRIYTQDAMGVCLSLTAQTGGTAVSSYGNTTFTARSSELISLLGSVLISGLILQYKNVTTSQTLSNDDVIVKFTNSSAITVSMPSNAREGKVLFLKRINAEITLSSSTGFYKDGSLSGSTTQFGGTYTMFAFYDGSYWHLHRIGW